MRTSEQWWEDVKSSPDKLNNWLKQQFTGESTASDRIQDHIRTKCTNIHYLTVIDKIRQDEETHARWVRSLLDNRNISISTSDFHGTNRYWDEVLTKDQELSFEDACGIAAHAEEMRLERIKVISEDQTAPWDIRETFMNILQDEMMHASAFKTMAKSGYNNTAKNHAKGLEALGLII